MLKTIATSLTCALFIYCIQGVTIQLQPLKNETSLRPDSCLGHLEDLQDVANGTLYICCHISAFEECIWSECHSQRVNCTEELIDSILTNTTSFQCPDLEMPSSFTCYFHDHSLKLVFLSIIILIVGCCFRRMCS